MPRVVVPLALCAALSALAPRARAAGGQPAAVDEARPIAIASQPAELLLGTDAQTTLMLDLGGGRVDDLRYFASVGQVVEQKDLGYGRFSASYRPPVEFFPQVAIVAAVATIDGQPALGWVVIPLIGQGEISVPGAAGTPVTVQVGKRSFGPQVADASGAASVRIQVPPGVEVATSAGQEIPLGAEPFSRVLLVPLRQAVEADGSSASALRAFAVTTQGEPLRGAVLQVKAKGGKVHPVRELAPGAYAVRWSPARSKAAKQAEVTVSLRGHRASTSKVALALLPPSAHSLEVALDPPQLGSERPASVRVRVRVLDGGGQPIDGDPALEAEDGELGPLKRSKPGEYHAELKLTEQDVGQPALDVTARATDGSGRPIEASAELQLAGGGEGGATHTAAKIATAAPTPTSEPAPLGVPAATPAAPGEGRVDSGASAQVATTVGSKPMLLLGVHAGFQSNFLSLYAPMLSLDATYLADAVLPGLTLQLGVDGLYQYGEARPEQGPLAGRSLTHHLAAGTLTVSLGYRLELMTGVAVLAGAGALGDYAFTVVDDAQLHSLSWGGLAQLGLAWGLGPGELVLRARYIYGGLQGGWGSASLLAGYALQIL